MAHPPRRLAVMVRSTREADRRAAALHGSDSQLAQVGDRFVIQYANANRFYAFTYPLDMIGDIAPPLIAMLPSVPFGTGSATITWFTNEVVSKLKKHR